MAARPGRPPRPVHAGATPWYRRWVSSGLGRGLTTRGRCLLAGGVAAMVCAFVLDERDLFRVGLVAGALPLLAIGVTALRSTQLAVAHHIYPERLVPGGHGQVVIQVTNTGPTRTTAIDLAEPAVPGLSGGMRYLLASLPRGDSLSVGYPITAEHRGRFPVGPPRLRVADPFDLWEDQRILPSQTDVLVVPVVVPLSGMPASSGARSAASGRAAMGTIGGDPDVGVRPYRSGDDIRTIHWRASARHDDLVVRLEEPVSHGGAAVLLDHRAVAHRGAGPASSLEPAVTLAASITLHLLAADQQVRLLSHTGAVVAQGHDIADDVLAGLAVLETDPDPTFRRPSPGRAGLIVAVLGAQTPADVTALIAGRSRSVTGVAFVLDTAAWVRPPPDTEPEAGSARPTPAGPVPIEAPDPAGVAALRTAGWQVVVVRPGDDLAAAWQRATARHNDFSGPVGRPAADHPGADHSGTTPVRTAGSR